MPKRAKVRADFWFWFDIDNKGKPSKRVPVHKGGKSPDIHKK